MSTTLDLTGLDRITAGLRRIGNPDATDLMVSWMSIIDTDNRTGVLAGLDKDGVPLAPVTYRPKLSAHQYLKQARWFTVGGVRRFGLPPNKSQRSGVKAGAKKGQFFANSMAGVNMGNLTSSEYRTLGGPPLAPRDQFSRVITNLRTGYSRTGPLGTGGWEAFGYWEEVVSTKGLPFLKYHFQGIGQKRRDLRGVRPDGRARAVEALRNWGRLLVRQAFGRGAA